MSFLVLGDASESLAPPAGAGVKRSHQLVCLGGAREDLGIEVGQFVGVFPLVRFLSERDEVRRLYTKLRMRRRTESAVRVLSLSWAVRWFELGPNKSASNALR
jgi:hypothetical protein